MAAAGCSGEKPAPPAAAGATAATAPAPAPAPAPGPAPAPVPRPLATADGRASGVRAEVTELKRSSGGTLTLKFAIVNESTKPLQVSDVGIGQGALIHGSAYTIDGVHVIDAVGKKKYFVATDSAQNCVCSQFEAVPPGGRVNHWAKFSAPPDDVERLSVVIPYFAPMDDVPISR
jgi:hypothetical protein